jgi:catecholate siderophore receptor
MFMSRRLLSICVCLVFLGAVAPVHAVQQPGRTISGVVADTMGGVIAGAIITLTTLNGARPAISRDDGSFRFDDVTAGTATLTVTFDMFAPRTIVIAQIDRDLRIVMDPLGVTEAVHVQGGTERSHTVAATRTGAPVRDVPQAISNVGRDLIADQAMSSMADVVSYVPGVGMAQGEGHRDAPIFRGNTSTSDFYVDGLRDDTQYLRDVYNVERVEVLKGPNGMLFGRGGVGGVINRVTRQANGTSPREFDVRLGSWDQRRITGDIGHEVSDDLSTRVTAMFERSDSFRRGATLERAGINPSFALNIRRKTRLTTSYEFFHDVRTVDRGIPSYQGRPLEIDASTFFGSVDVNTAEITVNALSSLLETRIADRIIVRNNTRVAAYDKLYRNLVPGAVDAGRTSAALSGYSNATTRQNVFNQTDFILSHRTGRFDHTILAGAEFGRQTTSNERNTAYFSGVSASTTSIRVPLTAPTTTVPVAFRQSATDANHSGVATVGALYAQDQIAFSPAIQVIVGMRYDRFAVDIADHRTASLLRGRDNLASPRAAVVYKPRQPVSVYASYTRAYLPRAGEQLASLSLTTQALEPENFRNYEVGVKWDVKPTLAATAALYRMDHGNVVIRDANDPTISSLVDGEQTTGLEVELSGDLSRRWTVQGGYAYQYGEITQSQSATVLAGARLAQLPRHSFSLWNRYDATNRVGVGVGVISMSDRFATTDNTVLLPAFARLDGAVFVRVTPRVRMHINLENVLDTKYYAAAHGNNNIAPGSPRAVQISLATTF